MPPWAKGSGSQTDILTPWYDGRAEIIPFRFCRCSLEGKREVMIGVSASNQEEVIREDEATAEGAKELKTLT